MSEKETILQSFYIIIAWKPPQKYENFQQSFELQNINSKIELKRTLYTLKVNVIVFTFVLKKASCWSKLSIRTFSFFYVNQWTLLHDRASPDLFDDSLWLMRDAVILHLHKPNKSQKVKRTMLAMYLYWLTVYHALYLSKETFNTRAHGQRPRSRLILFNQLFLLL